MRIAFSLLVGSIGVLTGIMVSAMAAPESRPTIQQCGTLLPKGKVYKFSLIGSVDTRGGEPHVSGELSVSDETTVDKPNEGGAFAQCVGKLVR